MCSLSSPFFNVCTCTGFDLDKLYNKDLKAEARQKLLENEDLLRLVGDEQAIELLKSLED